MAMHQDGTVFLRATFVNQLTSLWKEAQNIAVVHVIDTKEVLRAFEFLWKCHSSRAKGKDE